MSARYLLRVEAGPTGSAATGFALVQPGRPLRVGRDPGCELVLHDPRASRVHCQLSWDGTQCVLRDLGSSNGTLVNEQPVQEAILRPGDQIVVGDSRLTLQPLAPSPAAAPPPSPPRTGPRPIGRDVGGPAVPLTQPAAAPQAPAAGTAVPQAPAAGAAVPEAPAATPALEAPASEPREADEPPPGPVRICRSVSPITPRPEPMSPEPGSLHHALARAMPAKGLYALVDGAGDEQLPFRCAALGFEVYTLFEGAWAEGLAHVGPCLVALDEPALLLPYWLEGFGQNVGVLLESDAAFEDLHRHLREIFVVTDETDQEFFFRYYDPRVFRTFLPTCTPEQLVEFFGPVTRWFLDDEKIEGYRTYALEGARVVGEEIVPKPPG